MNEDMETKKITERIQTYENALKETGRPNVDFSALPEDLRVCYENHYKAVVIAEALNEGWKPNWDNSNERKWRPWFYMSPSGFAFNDACFDGSGAGADSGSRLCFKTEELAIYAGKQFIEIWKNVQLG